MSEFDGYPRQWIDGSDARSLSYDRHETREKMLARAFVERKEMIYSIIRFRNVRCDDVGDVMQAVYLMAWERRHQVRRPECLEPWLRKIAHRVALNFRMNQRRAENVKREFAESRRARCSSGPCDTGVENDDVREAVESLGKEYKKVIVLFYFRGWNVTEIATKCNCPEPTVRSRLQRARRLLERKLGYRREEFRR
jgi:RNA polymerase sigma-70 factor, ECF subfamily